MPYLIDEPTIDGTRWCVCEACQYACRCGMSLLVCRLTALLFSHSFLLLFLLRSRAPRRPTLADFLPECTNTATTITQLQETRTVNVQCFAVRCVSYNCVAITTTTTIGSTSRSMENFPGDKEQQQWQLNEVSSLALVKKKKKFASAS